jgi:hypothetical protein
VVFRQRMGPVRYLRRLPLLAACSLTASRAPSGAGTGASSLCVRAGQTGVPRHRPQRARARCGSFYERPAPLSDHHGTRRVPHCPASRVRSRQGDPRLPLLSGLADRAERIILVLVEDRSQRSLTEWLTAVDGFLPRGTAPWAHATPCYSRAPLSCVRARSLFVFRARLALRTRFADASSMLSQRWMARAEPSSPVATLMLMRRSNPWTSGSASAAERGKRVGDAARARPRRALRLPAWWSIAAGGAPLRD